jgi:hypothetical protein
MRHFISRRAIFLGFAALAAGCSSGGGTAVGEGARTDSLRVAVTHEVPLRAADAVSALLALADPASPGGATLTADEANDYAAAVPGFAADDSVDALGLVAHFAGDPVSAAGVSTVATALRHHVTGLRISGQTVTGLDLSSCSGAATATFDPRGGSYTSVELTYSSDGWASAHSIALTAGIDGIWRGALPGLASAASLVYALQLGQPAGDSLWLDNPRENLPGATGHVDYRQALSVCEPVVTCSAPPLARLVQSFARPDSLAGSTVSSDEFSWLVAQATWEGGPGIDDPAMVDPTVAALDSMASSGVAFEGSVYNDMRTFLLQLRMRLTSTDAVSLQRNPVNQYVYVTAPPLVQWMRVYYSTDGWNTPKVVECTPLGRAGIVTCGLGFLPAGALVGYAAIFHYATGPDTYVHARDGGNVFQAVP